MKKKLSLFHIINNTLLILIAFACTYPFIYILSLSISDGQSVINGEVTFLPKGINVEAYRYIFADPTLDIFRGLVNSFLYTIIGTVVSIAVTYATAYVLTRRQIKGRFFIMSIFIFTWVFEAGIIPNYIVLNALGYVNNPWVMIIPAAINTQYLIITKAFLDSMPYELEEAAYIDGANDIQIMLKIYLPISKTIIATVGVFYAVFIWNQYLVPQIYLKKPELQTIQLVIKKLIITGGDSNATFRTIMQNGYLVCPANLRAAAIFTAMLPIVCIYPLVQKYFKKGILIGSVKG